jgi:uncharacterized lipoprotein YmbA
MRIQSIYRAILVCGLLSQTGCFKLGRDTPVLQQYVLGGGGAQADAVAPQRVGGTTIGVRRLDLAKYLASPAIVVRRDAHRIVTSEYHRWGEDPMQGITRALARHLAANSSVGAVDVAPWTPRAPHDYLVQLHVSRFEGVADSLAAKGEAQLLATWEIIRPLDGAVLARGSTDYRQRGWEVGDYGALVKLLDAGLRDVSNDVITCMARLSSVASAGAGLLPVPAAIACARGD